MNEKNMPKEFWQRADSLQKRTGYQFRDPELLRLAFTQRSGAGGQSPSMNNERLEFLGDAALGLLVGEALYQEYPEADEGFMTIERSKLVCGRNLSAWGYEAGFDRMLRVCEGVEVSDAMVEDSVEAVAGAFFLDGGLDAVRALLQSFADYPDQGAGFDSRRHLERDCSYEKLGAPRYSTMRRRANGKIIFESTVSLDKEPSGTGLGADRTEAERNAARDAMCRLSHASAEEQKKRAVVLRARYRRVLPRHGQPPRGRSAAGASEAENAAAEKPVLVRDGVEYRIVAKDGPEHKPVFTAAAFRNGIRVAEAGGPSKKDALKALVREVGKAAVRQTKRGADAFRDLELAGLKNSPELKGRLQTCCERLGIGQPHYVDLPSPGGKSPLFFVELQLSGEPIVSGSGQSKRAAGQAAAWKMLQLLAADALGESGRLNADLPQLQARLESAFRAVCERGGEKDLRVEIASVAGQDEMRRARVFFGDRFCTEVPGLGENQARLLALFRAVTQTRRWKDVLRELKLSAPAGMSPQNVRPDLLLEERLKSSRRGPAEILSLRAGGSEDLRLYRTGLFVKGDLAACMTAPGKKIAEQALALLLLDRAARESALVPPLKKEAPAARTAPSAPHERRKPRRRAPVAPLPLPEAPQPKVTLKQRFGSWLRRMGDLYTQS
ncbi:putative dsRNA-binding protein [Pyramidobacter sp. C12-8]|uniref:putative dsRNA-binding protein n=1 Tax=Pyramidobacter sp. C12-8 TaxID=1943580 RepID=UPI00099017D8|nr:putative dsRNA-binding protein [Pyramidobacter sp. C12-8]OON88992.1 hypothetical protein B0D78_05905 [Pyramidobacter sp. C12-8]